MTKIITEKHDNTHYNHIDIYSMELYPMHSDKINREIGRWELYEFATSRDLCLSGHLSKRQMHIHWKIVWFPMRQLLACDQPSQGSWNLMFTLLEITWFLNEYVFLV